MRLSQRTIASRANGRRSRGPKTPEGKKISSLNALRHGLLSKCVVLPNESQEGFDALLHQHVDKFGPADGVEHGAVEDMAASVWRMRRLLAIETELFQQAMEKRSEPDERGRLAGAFSDLSRRPELPLINRYESRLHHMYQRSIKNLLLFAELGIADQDPDPAEEIQ